MGMGQGIDVSRYQGEIDWAAVKRAGVDFAVLRAGYGRLIRQQDPTFAQNYAGAQAAGLTVGAYWYSYATDPAGALAEAEACLAVVAGRALPLGLWMDQEYEPGLLALDSAARTDLVERFLGRIAAAGYAAGLYCSADWLANKLERARLADTPLWLAQYGQACTAPVQPCLWQYTGAGSVPGVNAPVDRDVVYRLPGAAAQAAMPSLGTANLRRGSRGQAVQHLQAVLAALGGAPGAADGVFGRKTQAAIKAFQRQAGLAADGVVGQATRGALAAAWARR